jgi:two-component system sensor histidine kinase KdpD
VVALAVFLVVALVVGRLAATSRERAREADARAREAGAREREAAMLARAASLLLAGHRTEEVLPKVAGEVAHAVGAPRARIALSPVPAPGAGEVAARLPTGGRSAWLYASDEDGTTRADLERVAEPLARLLDVAVERDRLTRSTAEAEATRRADAIKTSVLHAISHDLRSPLTAITTAGEALSDLGLGSADREELHSVLETETARLGRLIDDLLDLSRIEAGAAAPRPDWCDLVEVVAAAAAQVRARRGEHPVLVDLPADLPLVRADPVQMERVFANLIENAVKFSDAGEPVRVSGGTGGARVTIRVSNAGRPIPAGERARIFEPFVRGGGKEGTGLGLAISRGFVEANGGRIVLQGGSGDRRISFAVSLPLVAQPAPAG